MAINPSAGILCAMPVSRARPALPREFIALHKRQRITEAIAQLSAEQGYEATKISDIVRRAAVARKTLYDNFSGKEDVFLAAFDGAVEELTARVEESCGAVEGSWEKRIGSGLEAFLGYVAEEPALARLCLIEALSATPATSKRYEEALDGFVAMVKRALPHDDRLPPTIEETLVGGVVWIVYQQIRHGENEQGGDVLSELTEFMVAPYLGIGLAGAADK